MSDARPELSARHLLLCREAVYDPFAPGAGYSLRNLLVSLRPDDDIGYPVTCEEIVLFAQFFGDPSEHELWVEVYSLDAENERDERVFRYGPARVQMRSNQFVQGVVFKIRGVPFPRPGIYEFLLRRDEEEPLIVERLLLKE